MSTFARPFRITQSDGRELDGVEFPSGRVVLDNIRTGLIGSYISIEHVAVGPDDRIEWDEHRIVCSATISSPLLGGSHVHACNRAAGPDDLRAEHGCDCGMTWRTVIDNRAGINQLPTT